MSEYTHLEHIESNSAIDEIYTSKVAKYRILLACAVLLVIVGVLYAQKTIAGRIYVRHAIKYEAARVFTSKVTVEKGSVIGAILAKYNVSSSEMGKILKAAQLQNI